MLFTIICFSSAMAFPDPNPPLLIMGNGLMGSGQPGHSFPDECTGIRAHVQHLKVYGSSDPLNGDLVDPRFHYVTPRGKSPDILGLAGTWAADRLYGDKLIDLLERLYQNYPAAW